MRSKTPLLLMEQLVMVLVFALAAAVCVRAFVLSDQLSRNNRTLDRAVLTAETAAELWKSGGEEALLACGFSSEEGGLSCAYDADWTPEADEAHAAYRVRVQQTESKLPGLETAEITVSATSAQAPLFALMAARQGVAS